MEILNVEYNNEASFKEFYLAMYTYGANSDRKVSWKYRLKTIWRIITKGTPYSDQIVISEEEATRLVEFFNSHINGITSTTTINKNADKISVSIVRDVFNSFDKGDISISRATEIINDYCLDRFNFNIGDQFVTSKKSDIYVIESINTYNVIAKDPKSKTGGTVWFPKHKITIIRNVVNSLKSL
jgi:hypothetical protein